MSADALRALKVKAGVVQRYGIDVFFGALDLTWGTLNAGC
jgi:hypothetical protein